MRMVVVAAAVATMLAGAIPASGQVVVRDRDAVVHRHVDRGHHYGWYKQRADCRVVKVRTRLPNGNVIIKTRRSCY
jgi:hypothetical protein